MFISDGSLLCGSSIELTINLKVKGDRRAVMRRESDQLTIHF